MSCGVDALAQLCGYAQVVCEDWDTAIPMLRHVVAQPVWLEDAGKVMLGVPPSRPLYAL